jgi:signal transduction histidine kinase
MSRPALYFATRYGVAVVSVAFALALNLFISLEQLPTVVFLVAVTVSAWYGGLGGGLAATVLSALALDYFFLPDIHVLDFGPATWVWLATYLVAAILINWLQEAQRRLIAALRLKDGQKSEFMAVLAHELRNFISPVSNTVAVLKLHGAEDATIQQACATAERQIHNMTRLVNDLLEAARVTQGKVQLSMETLDLRAVVMQAMEGARPLIEARGHRLETSLPAAPMYLEADPVRLEQVFLNLLTNAAKYTNPGGRIWLTLEWRDRQLVTCVRDDGKGLDPQMLPHVFDLFVQADATSQGGLGIGLSLVRGLVEMHGGSVAALSAGPGHGSEFVVRLPATPRHSPESEVQAAGE